MASATPIPTLPTSSNQAPPAPASAQHSPEEVALRRSLIRTLRQYAIDHPDAVPAWFPRHWLKAPPLAPASAQPPVNAPSPTLEPRTDIRAAAQDLSQETMTVHPVGATAPPRPHPYSHPAAHAQSLDFPRPDSS